MIPYGSRLTANDFDRADRPLRVIITKRGRVIGKRQCTVSPDEDPSRRAIAREVDAMPPPGSDD